MIMTMNMWSVHHYHLKVEMISLKEAAKINFKILNNPNKCIFENEHEEYTNICFIYSIKIVYNMKFRICHRFAV